MTGACLAAVLSLAPGAVPISGAHAWLAAAREDVDPVDEGERPARARKHREPTPATPETSPVVSGLVAAAAAWPAMVLAVAMLATLYIVIWVTPLALIAYAFWPLMAGFFALAPPVLLGAAAGGAGAIMTSAIGRRRVPLMPLMAAGVVPLAAGWLLAGAAVVSVYLLTTLVLARIVTTQTASQPTQQPTAQASGVRALPLAAGWGTLLAAGAVVGMAAAATSVGLCAALMGRTLRPGERGPYVDWFSVPPTSHGDDEGGQ